MPILPNARHERFAQELAKGKSADEAYRLAGYKENRHNASRLKTNEHIGARVEEIVGAAARRTEASIERTLLEMGRLGYSDLRVLFRENGSIKLPSEWSDEAAACVSSVEVEQDEAGQPFVAKLKLWDKNSALDKLAKHLGLFVERHEHTGKGGGPIETIDVSALTPVERAQRLAAILAAGPAGRD